MIKNLPLLTEFVIIKTIRMCSSVLRLDNNLLFGRKCEAKM